MSEQRPTAQQELDALGELLQQARIKEHRERIAKEGIKSVADLEEERHRLLETNAALEAELKEARGQLKSERDFCEDYHHRD